MIAYIRVAGTLLTPSCFVQQIVDTQINFSLSVEGFTLSTEETCEGTFIFGTVYFS